MAKYLSQEWLDVRRELAAELLPAVPGLAGRVGWTVTGGPPGDATYTLEFEDGVLVASRTGDDAEAVLRLTTPYDVALAVDSGELDASVAFMQGRLKAEGDLPLLYALLRAVQGPGYAALTERLRAQTET